MVLSFVDVSNFHQLIWSTPTNKRCLTVRLGWRNLFTRLLKRFVCLFVCLGILNKTMIITSILWSWSHSDGCSRYRRSRSCCSWLYWCYCCRWSFLKEEVLKMRNQFIGQSHRDGTHVDLEVFFDHDASNCGRDAREDTQHNGLVQMTPDVHFMRTEHLPVRLVGEQVLDYEMTELEAMLWTVVFVCQLVVPVVPIMKNTMTIWVNTDELYWRHYINSSESIQLKRTTVLKIDICIWFHFNDTQVQLTSSGI